ncbi:UNVERIFIED_CONTAM: Malonyl-coenzyme:anthocyanin 5-O-glucoside-6'''-O-malonyltransferase, partial [Sesamum latifolium]
MATTIIETCRVPAPPGAAVDLLTVAPKLKESLSLTLKHYLPVAGDLIYPLNLEKKPEIRYVAGDSAVSLTIAVFGSDFDHLIGNHALDADQFYEFVTEIDPVTDESEYQRVPVMALKVTLFPGRGPLGIDTIFWKVIREVPLKLSSFPLPTNRVRATYILRQADIKKLKDLALAKKPDLRARIDPPVPANYFGNCLGHGVAKLEHKQLLGEEGFVIAAEAIADQIKNRVNNKEQVLKDAENWASEMKKVFGIRAFGVSGSPKFDLSSADFGWGRARKLEVVSIDGEKHSISLCKSRDSEGGLEVGLSLPKARMEAFAAIFEEGL